MGWLKKAANIATGGAISGIEGLFGSGLGGTFAGTALGAALGGPVGAMIGGSIGGQLDTNRANAKAIEEQNALNYQMWKEQNEYNTPANQVARLRAAGLNPNLFYSQGNPGNATSTPTMSAKKYDYNFAEAIDRAAVVLQIRNLAAQNNNLNAQTDNIKSQTSYRQAEEDLVRAQYDFYKRYGYFPNQSAENVLGAEILRRADDWRGNLNAAVEAYNTGFYIGDGAHRKVKQKAVALTTPPNKISWVQREALQSHGYHWTGKVWKK